MRPEEVQARVVAEKALRDLVNALSVEPVFQADPNCENETCRALYVARVALDRLDFARL